MSNNNIKKVLKKRKLDKRKDLTEDNPSEGHIMGANSFAYVDHSELACKGYVFLLDYPNMEYRTLARGTIARHVSVKA